MKICSTHNCCFFRITVKMADLSEMDVIKFRDNTMVCVTSICGAVKLNFGIRLEYFIDCVYM